MNDSNTSYSLWYQVLQMPKLLKNFKGKLIYLLRYVTKPFLPLGKTRDNCSLPRGRAVPTTALVSNFSYIYVSYATCYTTHPIVIEMNSAVVILECSLNRNLPKQSFHKLLADVSLTEVSSLPLHALSLKV